MRPSRDIEEDSGVASPPQASPPQPEAGRGAKPWEGVGFILDFEDRHPGNVAFIINVPGGEVTIHDLRKAAAAPELLEALKTLRLICSDIPIIERNPRFAEASRAALAAISRAEGRS